MAKKDKSERCSFCGRNTQQVEGLIEGVDNVFICNICVESSSKLLSNA